MVATVGAGQRDDVADSDVIRASLRAPERFGALHERHAAVLYRYAYQRVGAAAAEDVVAETFLAAFAGRRRYDMAHASARPWLFGILTNKIARWGRAERAHLRASTCRADTRARRAGRPGGRAGQRTGGTRQAHGRAAQAEPRRQGRDPAGLVGPAQLRRGRRGTGCAGRHRRLPPEPRPPEATRIPCRTGANMMDEMTRLADLGEALSPDEIPMARLRARTLTDTRPHRTWVRPVVVAAAAASAVAAGAVALAGTGGQPDSPGVVRTAAYEVQKNADGTVTFTVHDLRDLDGATGALNAAGIAGKVLMSTEDCTTEPNPADMVSVDSTSDMTASDTVVVSSSMYPSGGGVLVAVTGDGQGDPRVAEFGYVDVNKIPTCVNLAGYGEEPRPPSYGVEPRPTR